MSRVKITPIPESGMEPFELDGDGYIIKYADGDVYYIHGMSFPVEIVTVLEP